MNRPFLQLLVAARDTYNVSRVRSISGQSGPCFQYLTDLLAHFVSFPSFSLFFFCFLLLPFSPSISLDGNIKCSLSRRHSLRLLAVLLPFAYVPFFSSVSLYLCNERGPRAHSFDQQTRQKSQPVNYTTTRLIYYNYRGRELKFH